MRWRRSAPAAALLWVAALAPAHAREPVSDLTVETRAIPGSDVKEVVARGTVDAPPHAVRAVIADVEHHASVMPYVKESRVLERDAAGDVTNYQRLSFGMPFVQDRHYVIRITERRYRDGDGPIAYVFRWSLVDRLPRDASKDPVKVSVNSGFWDVRPGADGSVTDLGYCVYTDPAGSIPKWMVGLANNEAIPKLFAAVAAAARSSRYASASAPAGSAAAGERPALGGCAADSSRQ